ncbi:MAG: Bax inhibitor-1/YccA family protein [Alphaproteobacteria bacterium]|nr:Bax inhibitor-1/YccA family protein [Alphaproteobacteria bacterium]
MANDYNRVLRGRAESAAGLYDAGLRSYMLRVYNYMIVGLGLTGVTAWIVANVAPVRALFYQVQQTATGYAYGLSTLGWVALIAPIGLVLLLSFRINRMSLGAAQLAFWGYASLVGIALAPILLLYTGASVAEVFFITAATFGAMSLYGYTTGRDLTGFGSFLFMGLIGIVIAMVVNMFLHSAAMQFVISVIGVLIFTGLTAYDTQAIKESYSANLDGSLQGRAAIMGALRLYLDFINLFIMLMQLMGQRR